MRAFVITLDAIVGLTFIFLAIVLINSQTITPSAHKATYLKQFSLDVLTVLEKSGELDLVIRGNSTGTRRILEHTPDLICIQVSIIDSSQEQVATFSKYNCGGTGRLLQVAAMPFVHDGEFYVVKAQSWHMRELS